MLGSFCANKIEVLDELYGLLLELLHDCLISNINNTSTIQENQRDNNSNSNRKNRVLDFYSLSNDVIKITVSSFLPYYENGNRHDFALAFGGMCWHSQISEESASAILKEMANAKDDEEIDNRLTTLSDTYRKANDGEAVTGSPTLEDLILKIKLGNNNNNKNFDLEKAKIHLIIENIKSLWYNDIALTKESEQQSAREKFSNTIISVSNAIRLIRGHVTVVGKVVGINIIQPMITGLPTVKCESCSATRPKTYDKPVWKATIRDHNKSWFCECEANNTVVVGEPSFIASREIQIHDIEKINDLEQLSVLLFDTKIYYSRS